MKVMIKQVQSKPTYYAERKKAGQKAKKMMMALIGLMFCVTVGAIPKYEDTAEGSIYQLFERGQGKYVIRYAHEFRDTLYIPSGSELKFKGGRLKGPVVFCDTKLSGSVNLKGSHIMGSVRNKKFDASWLCMMDGKTDDAPQINEMIAVCGNIFFPKGTYRLVKAYQRENFHIGIRRNNVTLTGERGTVFLTRERLGIVCVYTKPNDIPNSVRNVRLKNITFRTVNDGNTFLQWTHAIQTKGVNGFMMEKCRIEDFWGDGICLNHYGDTPETGERARNQNVKIVKNTIVGGDHHNNRNGISVINGKNVLIKKNIILNTSRHDMPGAIDVEPNNSAYTMENIEIIGNTIKGSRGNGGAVQLCVTNGSPGRQITVKNNNISDCNTGVCVHLNNVDNASDFMISNNSIAGDTSPFRFVGDEKLRAKVIKER